MSAKSRPREPRGMPAQRPTERAFVVQFEPVGGMRSRFRGRVEMVASGEAARFRSMKQLLTFLREVLRRQATEEPPR